VSRPAGLSITDSNVKEIPDYSGVDPFSWTPHG
jgi:hypothetical protein